MKLTNLIFNDVNKACNVVNSLRSIPAAIHTCYLNLETTNRNSNVAFQELEVQKRQLIDMLSMHAASCIKHSNTATRTSPTQYNMIRTFESPSTFPTTYEAQSPYIRPESANILASSYTCVTPLNGDNSIDAIASLDNSYMTQQIMDPEYRAESVLSLQPNSDGNYVTTDGYLPKATNLLVPIEHEQDYYDPEVHYNMTGQQCHAYPGTVPDAQAKMNSGLNDGCLV